MYKMQMLPIPGYQDEPASHRFWRQEEETDQAMLLLPGADVFLQTPILYYCFLEGLRRGADILWVGYHARPQFAALSREDKGIWARQDTAAAYQELLEQRSYKRLTLIGKSLGTLALEHLLSASSVTMPVQVVWLTPLLRDQLVRAHLCQVAYPSLLIIGTQDHQYDPTYLREVQQRWTDEKHLLVIEGADHGLAVGVAGTDTLGSLQVLEQVMRAIQAFLR